MAKNQKIIKICTEKFIFLNYSKRTSDIYLCYIKQFLDSLNDIQIIHCNSKHFQYFIDNYKFTSISQQNQVINAIRFLYKYGLNKKYDKVSFKRPKKEKKLPRVIDGDVLKQKIETITNIKHRTILTLAYSVGSCQRIFKKYIDNDKSFHSLRHSCFTNLLENGTNLRTIQVIAGHSSSKTTEIYTHISKKALENVVLPI